MHRAELAVLLLSLALVACDPHYSATGSVVGADGKPLTAATVTKSCHKKSGEAFSDTVKVDAQGKFSFGGVGGAFDAPTCILRFEATGYQARTMAIKDVCYENTQDRAASKSPCTPTDGVVALAPLMPAP